MPLKIFKYCWKRSVLLRGTKVLIFSILLTIVIHDYALDIYTKYHDKTTVFVSQTYPIDDFTLPFITMCIKNKFKPTVLNKYGLDSWTDFVFGTFEDNKWKQENISIWNTYVEASYLLKRDLEIQLLDPWSPIPIQFSVGKNYIKCETLRYTRGGEVCKNGSNILIEIKEYFTMSSGTCYGLKSNLQIPASQVISMSLHINKSLPYEDFPEVCLFKKM